jgi:LysR family hydrogen peroxide-inducible transcriptional activator
VTAEGDGPGPRTGSSLETIRYMVVSGLGITVVPRTSVENRGDGNALLVWRPLAAPAPTRRLALVWRKTFPRREAIKLLREAIFAAELKGVAYLPKEKAQESED